ncbi:hypothetical protein BT93_L1340 [Corymbia citriodora subsp. variegata]|uniref:TIR domain-containing protein n=1 Tax=Corymbia citriodora subsp. variegata TaxID=360336 RepID=A0A8T0CMW6_CORYI|nr:hypothetical protein BT93_L1340 [Corymbia citriodora subsp. variegata]
MECKKNSGQIVLPVFYNVKPYEVRELRGKFGKAFKSRVHRFKEDVKQNGPVALRELVESRVFESEKLFSGREGELVNKLVELITHKLQYDLSPSPDLVGFDDHVAKVTRLVDIPHSEIQTIVIYGIGGIGKTTLATSIYKKLFNAFECRSFLKDTREKIKSKGMEYVQSLLISDITKSPASTVHDSERGINMIRLSCEKKKVLILLDDVDCQNHLDKLIGDCKFGSGSKIIITCRDKNLFKPEYKLYKLSKMNHKDSLLLFNKYAFKGKQPTRDLLALSSDIVETTGGLPLALVIVGSLLKGKPKGIWIETLEKLRKVPNEDVQKMLRISYDSWGYEEQQMFLDIACFFIGIDQQVATYLWDDLNFFPRIKLRALINCSSIYVDDNNELRMHDQLRDLGRAIAYPANKKPWDSSRVWDEKAISIQRSKENRNIEALRLDKNGSSMFMEQKSFERMPYLKFLRLSEIERLKVLNLSWCSNFTGTPDLSAFENLEMLILKNCENLKKFDPSIRKVKRLVSLNLSYCGSLEVLPADLGELKELKELVIDETDIQEIPEFIRSLEKLETLSAMGCRLLTQVPSSISHLVSLSTMNLNTCKKLQELPDSFQTLGKLQRLSLERCYMLKEIPPSIRNLGELVELDLSSTRIKELPDFIGELNKLEILRISHSQIGKLPSAIGKLKELRELDASGCHRLKGEILLDKGGLSSLSTLRLGSAKISRLTEDSYELSTLQLHELSTLDHLDLLYCSELQSLPKPPSSLSSMQLTCQSDELPSLSHLNHLKKLTLHSCMSLRRIRELPSNIKELRVQKCPKLERLSDLPKLKFLLELDLLQCYGLERLDLEALECLRKLDVSISTELSNLDDFEDLESLRYSDLQSYDEKVDHLHAIEGLEKLGSLEVLNISRRQHIQQLNLSNSKDLKQLIVNNCESLDKIDFHDSIKSLERYDTDGCMPHIPGLLPRDRT